MFGALGGLGVLARGLSSAAFALSLLAGCAGQSLDHVLARDLASKGGLSCSGHLGWNDTQVQHVVLWLNGSGIYSSAFVHPSIEDALEVNPVAYMTLDKPGIRAPFQDPAALTVDDGVLEQYTQGHVLECARQALTWSDEQFGTNVRFHFRGHSEGTLISLLLYEKLLSEEPALAARVSSLVLSGVALEPFDKLVERQTNELPPPQRAAFFSAIERCDWPKMRNRMAVSCAYLADAYARPSGRALFESLARRAPAADFFVFHGNNDLLAPASYVRELEAWHATSRQLDITFRFFEGGHVGAPPAVTRELSELLVRLTRPVAAAAQQPLSASAQ